MGTATVSLADLKRRTFGIDAKDHDVTGRRQFVAYFYFVGFSVFFQIGVSICLVSPHIELHVPCGFFRIGWVR